MERCYFWDFVIVQFWLTEMNKILSWFSEYFKWNWVDYKNIKVSFCGLVQLLAYFIPCYMDELLTHFDYLVCSGVIDIDASDCEVTLQAVAVFAILGLWTLLCYTRLQGNLQRGPLPTGGG